MRRNGIKKLNRDGKEKSGETNIRMKYVCVYKFTKNCLKSKLHFPAYILVKEAFDRLGLFVRNIPDCMEYMYDSNI